MIKYFARPRARKALRKAELQAKRDELSHEIHQIPIIMEEYMTQADILKQEVYMLLASGTAEKLQQAACNLTRCRELYGEIMKLGLIQTKRRVELGFIEKELSTY